MNTLLVVRMDDGGRLGLYGRLTLSWLALRRLVLPTLWAILKLLVFGRTCK